MSEKLPNNHLTFDDAWDAITEDKKVFFGEKKAAEGAKPLGQIFTPESVGMLSKDDKAELLRRSEIVGYTPAIDALNKAGAFKGMDLSKQSELMATLSPDISAAGAGLKDRYLQPVGAPSPVDKLAEYIASDKLTDKQRQTLVDAINSSGQSAPENFSPIDAKDFNPKNLGTAKELLTKVMETDFGNAPDKVGALLYSLKSNMGDDYPLDGFKPEKIAPKEITPRELYVDVGKNIEFERAAREAGKIQKNLAQAEPNTEQKNARLNSADQFDRAANQAASLRESRVAQLTEDGNITTAKKAADAYKTLNEMGTDPTIDPSKMAKHQEAVREASGLNNPEILAKTQKTLEGQKGYEGFVAAKPENVQANLAKHGVGDNSPEGFAKRDLAPSAVEKKQLYADAQKAEQNSPQAAEREVRNAFNVRSTETLTPELIAKNFDKMQTQEQRDKALAVLDKAQEIGGGKIAVYQRDETGAIKYAQENGKMKLDDKGQPMPLEIQEKKIDYQLVKADLNKNMQKTAEGKSLLLADKNRDGKIDLAEFKAAEKNYGDNFTKALTVALNKPDQDILKDFKVAMQEGKLTPQIAQATVDRATPKAPDAVAAGQSAKSTIAM